MISIPQTLNTPVPVTPFNPTLPAILPAGSYLGVNSTGDGIAILPAGGGPMGPPGPAGANGANGTNGTAFTVVDVTVDTTVVAGSQATRADATAGGITVTLPLASTVLGQLEYVAQTGNTSNAVTVTAHSGDDIAGSSTLALVGQNANCLLLARASGWDVLAQVVAPLGPGAWTPTDGSGASLTFVAPMGQVVETVGPGALSIGVITMCSAEYPSTADTSPAVIVGQGLPALISSIPFFKALMVVDTDNTGHVLMTAGASNAVLLKSDNTNYTNADLSGKTVTFVLSYIATP